MPTENAAKNSSEQHHAVLEQNQYAVKKFLGCGGGGHVYLATDGKKKQRQVAVKVVRQNNPLGEGEWKYWSRLHHPNMIHLLDKFESNGDRYYIMEFAANGTMFEWLKRNKAKDGLPKTNEQRGRRWVRQILEAMRYCHHQGLYHFDIKSSNILLDSNLNIKLSDFGTMKSLEDENVRHNGCRFYRPPEVLRNIRLKGPESFEAVDVWAMGATLLRIFSGGKLISYKDFTNCDSENKVDILRNIRNNIDKVPSLPLAIEGVRDLLVLMLQMDPRRRPSCSAALKNPWVLSIPKRPSRMSTGTGHHAADTSADPKAKSAPQSPTRREVGVLTHQKSMEATSSGHQLTDRTKRPRSGLAMLHEVGAYTGPITGPTTSSQQLDMVPVVVQHKQHTAEHYQQHESASPPKQHRKKSSSAKGSSRRDAETRLTKREPGGASRKPRRDLHTSPCEDMFSRKPVAAHSPQGFVVNSTRVSHHPHSPPVQTTQQRRNSRAAKNAKINEKLMSHVMPAMTALLYSNTSVMPQQQQQQQQGGAAVADNDAMHFNEMITWVLNTYGRGTSPPDAVQFDPAIKKSATAAEFRHYQATSDFAPTVIRGSRASLKTFVQQSSMVLNNPNYLTKTHMQLHVVEGRREQRKYFVPDEHQQDQQVVVPPVPPVVEPAAASGGVTAVVAKKKASKEKPRKRSSSRALRPASKDPTTVTTSPRPATTKTRRRKKVFKVKAATESQQHQM